MGVIVKRIISLVLCVIFMTLCGTAEAMSLNVQNADMGELLRSVARMGNLNLILDESVQGKISMKIDEDEPEEIIQKIVKVHGLSVTKSGNTWIVTKEDNMQKAFGRVHVIPVKYAPLEDVQKAVELNFAKQDTKVVETGSDDEKKTVKAGQRALVDVSTGSLLVYGTDEEYQTVKELVEQLDVPARQVSIEAKVVSMKKEDISKLGVQWDWSSLPQYIYNSDGDAVRPSINSAGTAGGIISFGKGPGGMPYEWQFSANIEALVTHGKAEVLSRPNIVTMQGKKAIINIGGEVPVPKVSTTNSTVTTSIEYRPVGIILSCRPMVNNDGYITSEIHTEVSSPQYVEEMNAYSFNKRSADTTVRLKDGETMVIGGLISSDEVKSMSKVPFLGDLPILGNLFRSVRTNISNSEIIIMLQAKIVP